MDGYNGWTNHETWATALHWDNDEGSYLERCEMVEQVCRESSSRDEAVHGLADWLDDRTEDIVQTALEEISNEWTRLYIMDLMPRGNDVNWREIVGNWIDEEERDWS